ncbi:MAG: hypothetical protein N3I35_06390 [Clostridia bacterium]|nr:hypothetical protein [Clostridia bacterium]
MIAITGSIAFSFAIILYILIALGQPYGEFAMGGKYKIVPKEKRFIFGISVIVQIAAIVVVLQTAGAIPLIFSQSTTRGICFFFAAFLSLNVIANAISNSKKEKYVITPISFITAICFWITAIGR